MRRSKLHTKLEEGRQIAGKFAPAEGAEFATPGVLSWSVERGAELELVDLSHPWPTAFGETFTVYGQPHDGEALTLLGARVRRKTDSDRTSHIDSWTLALGAHVDPKERWPRANYRPASLHEWLPETGPVNRPPQRGQIEAGS